MTYFNFDKLPSKVQAELEAIYDEQEQDKVRHRDIEIMGCRCAGCCKLRAAEHEANQHRLFLKALKGIRERSLTPSSLTREARERA